MLRIFDGGLAAIPAASCLVREESAPAAHNARMREHIERLRLIQSVVSLSVMALRRQDAERDEDIASVLDHYAATQLNEEVCELEDLLVRAEAAPAAAAKRSRAG